VQDLLRASTQQFGFCSSTALSAVVLPYQRLNRCRFRTPLFLSSLLCWLTSHVSIQSFRKPISSWRSLLLHSHAGYRHQVHIRSSFAISFVSSPRTSRSCSRVVRLSPRSSRGCSRVVRLSPRTSRGCSRVVRLSPRSSRTKVDSKLGF